MVEIMYEGQLTRSSLGRLAFIGELYDCRNESLTSRSLFKSSFPANLIESRDVNRMEMDYRFTENISDRFELFNVEAELQISVLLGLISLEGSGKFLNNEMKSKKSVSCSLVCKLQTVGQKMFASFDEILQHIDLTAVEDPQYTHVIVEVNWGANCILNLESFSKSDSEKEIIRGRLAGELSLLKQFLTVKGAGFKYETENSNSDNNSDVSVKIYSDVVPDGVWPTSVEGFSKFVSDIPRLLKSMNEGKGKPLSYVMIPLTPIRKLAKLHCAFEAVVVKIQESFLFSTIYFFEEITQIKQRLRDFLVELNENKKYVRDEEVINIRKKLETLVLEEAKIKEIICENWVSVRSGEKTMKDLIRMVEKFKNSEMNLFAYEEFCRSQFPIFSKLSRVKDYIEKGIIYLGKGEKFDTVLSKNLNCEFIVLVVSSEFEKADPEFYRNSCYYFLTLANKAQSNTLYVVIDFDYTEEPFLNFEITETSIFHFNENIILSRDLYNDYLADLESNFIQLKEGCKMEYALHKPCNRVALEIACPGSEIGTCSFDPVIWTCFRCKSTTEYGFDDYYYCSCGKSPVTSFEYQCKSPKHGSSFISGRPEFIQHFLSNLRPLKELNLLVLGQSGVGKSTWINSIINYLSYDSLDIAKECGVLCTIPLKFFMQDSKTLEQHVVEIGWNTDNEITETGNSATQFSHTYNFIWDDRCVRIIDTPGLGDTRGIHQDQKNLKNIIDHIGHLKEIHGVCILLKASDNRINALFAYCLKELLTHLHKSVAKNIVFCFTNARSSFYSPGVSSTILEKIIDGIGIKKDLTIGFHNMFCLDNEAFLFLCSLDRSTVNHSESLVRSFKESWEISLKETRRLFNTIKTFTPHQLKETLSLVTARNRILSLTKPIAEISKTIQMNVAAMEKKEELINASDLSIEKLLTKLEFDEVQLESVPLNYPRTVCTSPSCVDYVFYRSTDLSEIEYKTHCHSECYLNKVTPKTVNNAALKKCSAINGSGYCTVCGCSWENHMHLTYSQKKVEKTIVNKSIEAILKKEKSEKEDLLNFMNNLKEKIDKFKQEQEIVIQASVKFGTFLRKNAISYYNDSVAEYLEYLIAQEENKPFKSATEEKLIKSMKETLIHYKKEVEILQDVMNKGRNCNIEVMSVQEVYDLEQTLYNLELTGEWIRQSVEVARSSNEKMFQYAETTTQLKNLKIPGRKKKNDTIWNRLGNIFNKQSQIKSK